MKIIQSSIVEVDKENSVFYKLAKKLACNYDVEIISRKFTYELKSNHKVEFTIKNLQEVFYDWGGKRFSFKKIAGDIIISSYQEAHNKILLDFSHHATALSPEELDEYTTIFWQEVATHFTLPPTHVFFHSPDHGSLFTFGVFWTFCYIFLNNNTKQGIVLQADSFD